MVSGIFIIILKVGMLITIMCTVFLPVKLKGVSCGEDSCTIYGVLDEARNLSSGPAAPSVQGFGFAPI